MRKLSRLARALLRGAADDAELAAAVAHLAARGFDPPRPPSLPQGDRWAAWAELSAREPAELQALAAQVVGLPDPAERPAEAAAVVELLLRVPGEDARARVLVDRLGAAGAEPGAVALWRFRLAAAALPADEAGDAAAWEPLLDALRAACPAPSADLAAGLRVAASHVLAAADAHGAAWLAPALDGRRIVGAELAAERRPALRDELLDVYRWLVEATRTEGASRPHPLDEALAAVETLDADGDWEAGTAALLDAVARAGDRADLAHALAARADALLAPGLAGRAVAVGAAVDEAEIEHLSERAHAALDPPAVTRPEPARGWTARIEILADPEQAPADDAALAMLDAAGSRRRAARGWLAREDHAGLMQAWRLRADLAPVDLSVLRDALRVRVPDDEVALAGDAEALQRGLALATLLPPGPERDALALRLRAASPPAPPRPRVAAVAPSDDPHAPDNRLAAAFDLLEAGRPAAAASIAGALLRRLEDEGLVGRLVQVTARLLAEEHIPEGIVAAAERALLAGGPLGAALLDRLVGDARAAFPLHAALHRAAQDERRPEPLRARLLEAWLGIWQATETVPDPELVRDLLGKDAGLAALAAARLAGDEDPVAAAARFLARWPPRETPAAEWARQLAEVSASRRAAP